MYLLCINWYSIIGIHIHSQNRSIYSKKKSFNQCRIDYVGTTSVDPSWSEANDQLSNYKDDNDEEIDDVCNQIESQVFILVVILIIISYVCLGTFICQQFED
ncbi:unnamed protein product [Rotaria sordida]|uniref:Uncharacterized protein n=1 Tax=Rotaria sordida TaxID=392033 RepID=A0A815JDM2_9BILA|nr:unnamed protein product [Rotaria sordida]CAF4100441.1 unnamed protein product [Rotaria sordida]